MNHDRLIDRIAKRIEDKRMLKLLRSFLNSGVMENGLVSPTTEGAPQGGPMSPLLSNIVLDELDKELERRGHSFVRYADDFKIYVRSERAGRRVMESITRFITKKLKLKLNSEKSAVGRPWERKFLGFTISNSDNPKRRIAEESLERFKNRVRELTKRSRGRSVYQVVTELAAYLRGWRNYYGHCDTPKVFKHLDSWIRRRLRCYLWKQWQNRTGRYKALLQCDADQRTAKIASGWGCGPWRASRSIVMSSAAPETYFRKLGLPNLYVPLKA